MFVSMTPSVFAPSISLPVGYGSPHRRSSPLLDELDREWARLDRRASTWRTVRSWISDGWLPLSDEVGDLDALVALTQPSAGDGTGHDDLLRRLIALAGIDDLAARIVLQRILPGVISGARRWTLRDRSADPVDVVVGAAWLAIRGFDLDGRHCHVAPALIADSIWIGFRRGSRRKTEQEVPVSSDVLAMRPAPEHRLDPTTALAGTIRAADRAGVPEKDLEFLRHLVRAGSPSAVAAERGVSPRTVRNHRDIATAQVRSALGGGWSDWADPLTAAA